MGSPIETWEAASVYFTGAGTAMPALWLLLSAVATFGALIYGAKHESESYARCKPE